MKKLIFITLLVAFAIGIAASDLPIGLRIFQDMKEVEPILKQQGYVFKSQSQYTREYTNDKIEYLVRLVLTLNSADEMTDWELNYYSEEPAKLFQQLSEKLTKAYGKSTEIDEGKRNWDVDTALIAVLERLDEEGINIRISFENNFDPYDDWW